MEPAKPCPFCANEAFNCVRHGRAYFLECSNCKALGPRASSDLDAYKKWEQREPMSCATSQSIALEVIVELHRAENQHSPMNSPHEGYAVVLEKVEEMWDEIKLSKPGNPNTKAIRQEAIQVGAMAIRLIKDTLQ